MAVVALFAFVSTTDSAEARKRVRIVAPKAVRAPHKARVAARVSRAARRVVFFVDGRRRWVARTPRRKFRRIGYLHTARMARGRHRLKVRARLAGGRVATTSRVLYVAKSPDKPKKEKGKRRGRKKKDPTPSPEPEGDLLLDAGFESGLENWNTAGVGDVVPTVVGDLVRSGERAAKFLLSGSQGRSELILGGNGGNSTAGMVEFREGDERYYAFSFNVQSMVYGRPGAHNLIMQLKSDGTGSPNFGLQLWDYAGDDGHSGGRGLWSSGEAMGGDRFLGPVSEGQWHDIVIHFKASSQGVGFYRVYLDGTLVDSRSGVSTIVPGHSYAYIKNGIYRNGGNIPGASEIRLDAARLGASWNSVVPG